MRRGLTLAEVILSLGLLLIATLTIVRLFTQGISGLRHAKVSTVSAFLAQGKMEELLALPSSCIKEEEGSFEGFLSAYRYQVRLKGYSKDPALRKLKLLEVEVIAPDGGRLSLTSLKRATSGRIAFVSDRDRNREIYVMSADGGAAINLTKSPANESEPALSPDGREILFVSNREKVPQIYRMKVGSAGDNAFTGKLKGDEQKEITKLTEFPLGAHSPNWSPDGKTIAFTASDKGYSQIFTMREDGSGKKNVTNTISHESAPFFSPDGQKIVFVSARDGDLEVYVMDREGGGERRLTESRGWGICPRYSPDGTKIAFVSTREGKAQVSSPRYLCCVGGVGSHFP